MKTITIFSDTHGNKTLLKKCQQICNECDVILHAGDGNCDVFSIDGAYENQLSLTEIATAVLQAVTSKLLKLNKKEFC